MIRALFRASGWKSGRLLAAFSRLTRYRADRKTYRRLAGQEISWGKEQPILHEWQEPSGRVGTYMLQDLTVARWIHDAAPTRHVDVGSRIDGFIGNLASFRRVEVIDIRPPPQAVPGVLFHQIDLMRELPTAWVGSTDSLSCLHTIEHFGLGRYGDRIDPMGHLKGLEQLKQMVKPGGLMFLSTPIGPERVEFNAHRVFAAHTLLGWFEHGWTVERFAFIDDANCLHTDVDPSGPEVGRSFGCTLGVGIVMARKALPIQQQ